MISSGIYCFLYICKKIFAYSHNQPLHVVFVTTVFWVFLSFASLSQALYPTSSDVVELTPSNFNKLVVNSDEIWVVEFFAPWCGHCQSLVPEYTKAASALKV